MALVQEEPMVLPQRIWSSILSEMIAYDPNPPKTGNNHARAKEILRLWQNWASLLLSTSPQDCCQDTENSKLSIHSSFTERKIILTNVLWRHQTFFPPRKLFAKLKGTTPSEDLLTVHKGSYIGLYIRKYSYRSYFHSSQYCWNEM